MAAHLEPDLGARIQAIAADHISGASAVTRELIALLIEARDRFGAETVESVARALCVAQPAMASVWNAAAVAIQPNGADAVRLFGDRVARAPQAVAPGIRRPSSTT